VLIKCENIIIYALPGEAGIWILEIPYEIISQDLVALITNIPSAK
jgi:hypothetical protein